MPKRRDFRRSDCAAHFFHGDVMQHVPDVRHDPQFAVAQLAVQSAGVCIGIDDAILNKPTRLTDEEFVAIRRHPELGDYVLRPISFFAEIRKAVRHHH